MKCAKIVPMTIEMWIAILILAAAILLFTTEWLRVDVVALGVLVMLLLTRLVTVPEALAGFSNPAVLAIAALFVVGGGVMQTGLAGGVGRAILQVAGNSPLRLILVLMATAAFLSGFMSNTGTVALLIPAIISLSRASKISPSKLLMPLSYGAILGGLLTLIGTTPNLIVSDILRENGYAPLGFFTLTPIGMILLGVGIVFMLLVGYRLMPARQSAKDVQRVTTPEELMAIYRLPQNLYRLRVRRASKISGKNLAESGLRSDYHLSVLEVHRPNRARPMVRKEDNQLVMNYEDITSLVAAPDLIIQANDLLVLQGDGSDVAHAAAALDLGVQPAESLEQQFLMNQEVGLAEVVLPPRSSLLGKTIIELRFGSRYKLTVLGLYGAGGQENPDMLTTPLRFGDTLLVQGPWENILALRRQRKDFVVIGSPDEMNAAPMRKKAPVAMTITLGMLALLIFNLLDITTASLLAAFMMIASGCLTMDDAYEAIDWKSIVLMAGMIPMSTALEKAGVVQLAAGWLTQTQGASPVFVLAVIFGVTALFTQFLSNTATTFLIAPVALASAANLGLSPYAFLVAVAVAASMAFSTPIASPANTLVMGAGNYRFGDYAKAGVPLVLLTMLLSVLLLPWLYPF